jgi:hypothetical protein
MAATLDLVCGRFHRVCAGIEAVNVFGVLAINRNAVQLGVLGACQGLLVGKAAELL